MQRKRAGTAGPKAGYVEWLSRRSDKLRHDGRPEWQHGRYDVVSSPRVAVVLHVYYPELLKGILDELECIPVPFDLLITNSSGEEIEIRDLGVSQMQGSRILAVPNRGRDILPLVSLVNAGLLDNYDLILKLHTKKSAWRAGHETLSGTGDQWRQSFLEQLVGSRQNVQRILSAFAEDPSIGVVTANGAMVGPEHWGADELITRELLRRLELDVAAHELWFPSGSMYWIRGFLLSGLRALDLTEDDFETEAGQIDGTTAHGVERAIGLLSSEAGFRSLENREISSREEEAWKRYLPGAIREPEARIYPFYLPQFHAFPENDSWWGEGFTEWNNVAASKPVFPGHRQPLLPGPLGFYDLNDDRVRSKQYALAQKSGIEGFMYYYYWFAGKRLMDMPVERLISSDEPHSFCLMWANENWTRRWDGGDTNVLIAQDYEAVPATEFIEDVRHLITDRRYATLDGRPIIAIYRITQIPDYREVIAHWRARALDFGLPGLELLAVDVGASMQGLAVDVRDAGLDGTLEFPPHNRSWVQADRGNLGLAPDFTGNVLRYDVLVEEARDALLSGIEPYRFPGVLVNFDNTARRQKQPDFWLGSNPFTFRRWLRNAVLALQDRPADQRLIFINAWNEWAEGAVLEPSQRFGSTYLQAVRSAVLCP